MKKIIFFPILLFLFFLTGCGLWRNFNTYFNLYYNTSKLFDEAEEKILSQRKEFFDFVEPAIDNATNQQFTKVIEKCSKILQFKSNTSYVDDALLMTGKAFFYQKNYLKALRKFRELLAKESKSELIPETELWVAKTQLQLKNYNEGLAQLETIRQQYPKKNELIVQSYIEEIKYYYFIENNNKSIELANALISTSKNGTLKARLMYFMGELYTKLENYEDALKSYSAVFDYSPPMDMELIAQFKYAKTLRLNNQNEKSISVLNNLRKEQKNTSSFDIIDFELGLNLKALGEYEKVLDRLIFVDTTYTNSTVSAAARYEIGDLYENKLHNYDSAVVYYQKASNNSSSDEYKLKIQNKFQLFSQYKKLKLDLANQNEQLIYLKNPEEYLKDSINYYAQVQNENENQTTQFSYQQNRRRSRGIEFDQYINSIATTNTNSIETDTLTNIAPPKKSTLTVDSLNTLLERTKFELGNLFLTELNSPDSALYYYDEIINNHPNSKLIPQVLYACATIFSSKGNKEKADSLYNFIYDNYNNTDIVNLVAKEINKPLIDFDNDPAKDEYFYAEEKLNDGKYQNSLKEFYEIFKKYPSSQYAPKALYTSGYILEEKLNLLDSAAAIYDSLIKNYPKTEYASNINLKLDFYQKEKMRIEKERQDSLMKIQEELKNQDTTKQDSTNQNINKQDSLKNIQQNDKIIDEQIDTDLNNEKIKKPGIHSSLMKEKYYNSLSLKENAKVISYLPPKVN